MEIKKKITKFNFNVDDISRIKFLVIHYVGALGGAEANCNYYAGGDRGASAHYFVGFSGEIWQSVEDRNVAWHCGAKSYKHASCRNANSIGIEMCVRKKDTSRLGAEDRDWYFEDATVASTIELTKYLMNKYKIPASNVIRHHDVTGKICPNPYIYNIGKHTWEYFKNAIQSNTGQQITTGDKATSGQGSGSPGNQPVKGLDGTVKVTYTGSDGINVRTSPTTGNNVREVIYGGTYTVVGLSADGDWYKLKSGGYITASEKYVKFTAAANQNASLGASKEFSVRVAAKDLNIRASASTVAAKRGSCPVGVYTIVEKIIAGGYTWGKLKSGAGWIALEYTSRL